MKLIIDIDEKIYGDLRNRGLTGMLTSKECECMNEAIYNGIPLPKSHGRLIDGSKLEQFTQLPDMTFELLAIDIFEAPTIIEADKENKE